MPPLRGAAGGGASEDGGVGAGDRAAEMSLDPRL